MQLCVSIKCQTKQTTTLLSQSESVNVRKSEKLGVETISCGPFVEITRKYKNKHYIFRNIWWIFKAVYGTNVRDDRCDVSDTEEFNKVQVTLQSISNCCENIYSATRKQMLLSH